MLINLHNMTVNQRGNIVIFRKASICIRFFKVMQLLYVYVVAHYLQMLIPLCVSNGRVARRSFASDNFHNNFRNKSDSLADVVRKS